VAGKTITNQTHIQVEIKAIIISVVLYGCGTSTPTLKEEYTTADWELMEIREKGKKSEKLKTTNYLDVS
jgi:hypothetical protein